MNDMNYSHSSFSYGIWMSAKHEQKLTALLFYNYITKIINLCIF